MNQRQFNKALPPSWIIRIPLGLTLFMVAIFGCGRSEPTGSTVVDPPTPSAIETEARSDASRKPRTELSGGIELPEGDIPAPSSNSTTDGGGGIEMPDIPVQNQSGTNDGAAATNPVIQYADWNAIQTEAQATGKVTVVDLWSLSCEPCLKEFPGLVRLHQDMGSTVQCIAVDMDYDGRKSRPPEHYADRVNAFLAGVGAMGFPTYISKTPSDDVFTSMSIASLPAVLVYNSDGQVAKIFVDAGETSGFTYEKDIVPLVADLASK